MTVTVGHEAYKIEITTDHPASHYGLGVCLMQAKEVGPADRIVNAAAERFFGSDPERRLSAAQIVVARCADRLMSDADLAQVARWLSQHPSPSPDEHLPDAVEMRRRQVASEYKAEVGDDTQGVDPVYYQLAYAKVAVKLAEATNGKMSLPLMAQRHVIESSIAEVS